MDGQDKNTGPAKENSTINTADTIRNIEVLAPVSMLFNKEEVEGSTSSPSPSSSSDNSTKRKRDENIEMGAVVKTKSDDNIWYEGVIANIGRTRGGRLSRLQLNMRMV